MYSVLVKEHIMIAHSLPDPFFGPAAKMHGATYVVDAVFMSDSLTDKNVVIDIGEASEILKDVLAPLGYQNLDELPQFEGKLTTTEFLAAYIHEEIKGKIDNHLKLRITLHESHIASASYED
jgi:6-pyruvoyl-tetrahydropterin synthase